jgi:hypothetical protein
MIMEQAEMQDLIDCAKKIETDHPDIHKLFSHIISGLNQNFSFIEKQVAYSLITLRRLEMLCEKIMADHLIDDEIQH